MLNGRNDLGLSRKIALVARRETKWEGTRRKMEASFPEAWGEAKVTSSDNNTWKDSMGGGSCPE